MNIFGIVLKHFKTPRNTVVKCGSASSSMLVLVIAFALVHFGEIRENDTVNIKSLVCAQAAKSPSTRFNNNTESAFSSTIPRFHYGHKVGQKKCRIALINIYTHNRIS